MDLSCMGFKFLFKKELTRFTKLFLIFGLTDFGNCGHFVLLPSYSDGYLTLLLHCEQRQMNPELVCLQDVSWSVRNEVV